MGIEEASLVEGGESDLRIRQGARRRKARAQRSDRLDRRTLTGRSGGAVVLRREGHDDSRQVSSRSPRGCHPLVRPNYGYFNKTLPRSAPQVVIITPITRCFDTANKYNLEANSTSPSGCRANRALIETLDKDALRAWVTVSRGRVSFMGSNCTNPRHADLSCLEQVADLELEHPRRIDVGERRDRVGAACADELTEGAGRRRRRPGRLPRPRMLP